MTRGARINTIAPLSMLLVMLMAACSSSTPDDLPPTELATPDLDGIFPDADDFFTTATVTAPPVTSSPSATTGPDATPTKTATLEPTPVVGPPRCLETLEYRLVNEQRAGEERYTLSSEEFSEFLDLTGIESFCIPEQFEEPFLNVDWDSEVADSGRMVSIGFDGLYPGRLGWGFGYIVYSTYDFVVGSEYNVFASEADRDKVRDGSMPNLISVGGVDGFTRFHEGMRYGGQPIYKVHIFPFESHYIAFVANIGHYDIDKAVEVLSQIESGAHPDLLHNNIRLMDYLVSTLQFSPIETP